MAKWIQDWTDTSGNHSIICDEIHVSHVDTYNALSGNPQYKVRLAVNWDQRELAIKRLLGQPETWPLPTIFGNVVAVEAQVINDEGKYFTDADGQTIEYDEKAFLDITYIPRQGIYRKLTTNDPAVSNPINQPVYIMDEEEPRIEALPINPNLFIWGNTAGTVPTDKTKVLTGQEAPSKFDVGQTLVHTIEGWCGKFDIEDYVATVHSQAYTSPITNKTYAAGTLMLRNYAIPRSFSFRSFRQELDPIPTTSFYDPAFTATANLKLIYEYRSLGWERFFRNDLAGQAPGYYYIHWRETPYGKYVPFPAVNHNIFFVGTVI